MYFTGSTLIDIREVRDGPLSHNTILTRSLVSIMKIRSLAR